MFNTVEKYLNKFKIPLWVLKGLYVHLVFLIFGLKIKDHFLWVYYTFRSPNI